MSALILALIAGAVVGLHSAGAAASWPSRR
ncbi:hypothetical protein QFZ66_000024 [Streptomyces sp. B4I13]|nr:hypothetical protein [Streptomyces sp. B4I13]